MVKVNKNIKDMQKQDAVRDGTLRLRCLHTGELDQTLSDVRLAPPPGELDETYASFLILAHSFYCENMTSLTEPEVHTHCC